MLHNLFAYKVDKQTHFENALGGVPQDKAHLYTLVKQHDDYETFQKEVMESELNYLNENLVQLSFKPQFCKVLDDTYKFNCELRTQQMPYAYLRRISDPLRHHDPSISVCHSSMYQDMDFDLPRTFSAMTKDTLEWVFNNKLDSPGVDDQDILTQLKNGQIMDKIPIERITQQDHINILRKGLNIESGKSHEEACNEINDNMCRLFPYSPSLAMLFLISQLKWNEVWEKEVKEQNKVAFKIPARPPKPSRKRKKKSDTEETDAAIEVPRKIFTKPTEEYLRKLVERRKRTLVEESEAEDADTEMEQTEQAPKPKKKRGRPKKVVEKEPTPEEYKDMLHIIREFGLDKMNQNER